MAATVAVNGMANEIAGPFAYGASLLLITASAVAWFRHHHDVGALGNGAMGALFVSGCAIGGASLLGFIPGVTGGLILAASMLTEIPTQFCAKFHEPANRPHLILGCEPAAIALAFLLSIVLGYSAPNFWGIRSSL